MFKEYILIALHKTEREFLYKKISAVPVHPAGLSPFEAA